MTDLNPKTFDALAAIQGQAYPTKDVTVYTDVVSYFELKALEQQANDALDGDEANEIDKKIDALREKIKASALTVHMRGFAPKVAKAIFTEARALHQVPEGEMLDDRNHATAFRWANQRVIAESIVRITDADGAVDSRHFDVDYIEGLDDFLAPEEMAKISDAAYELSFQSVAFDMAVNPDF